MAQTFPVDDARLMTLAGIAYGAAEKIPTYLSKASLVANDWSVVWTPGPGADPDNFAFVALNQSTKVAVLAIRGTYPNPLSPIYWENGQQDSPFGTMAAWKGSASAKISKGTNTGYQNLIALKDASGRSISDFVKTLDPEVVVCVTGHSLGGTLTPVMALELSEAEPQRAIYSISFAGMTPGNADFAALFGDGTPLSGRTRRAFNTLDSVSYGWNHVLATRNFFTPAPKGGLLVKLFLLLAWFRLLIGGYGFTAIGEPGPYTGSVDDPSAKHGLISYVIETLHQHMPDTYLKLMGAPPLPFSILFGSVTVDKTDLSDHAPQGAGLPVFHA
jgi:hypothetical protein